MTTRLHFAAGAHRYYLRGDDGKKRPIPAVSRLLGQLAKPQLVNWAARVAADYAVDHWDDLALASISERREAIRTAHDKARNTSAAKGTHIHSMAEHLLAGQRVDVPTEVQAQVQGLAAWWERSGMTRVAAEQRVWSPDDDDLGLAGYAGTLDLRVTCPRRGLGVLDVKTGVGVWPETAMQLEAYAGAEFMVVDGEDRPSVDTGWTGVVHVRPEGTTLHIVPPEARRNAAQRWEILRMLRLSADPWLEEQVG